MFQGYQSHTVFPSENVMISHEIPPQFSISEQKTLDSIAGVVGTAITATLTINIILALFLYVVLINISIGQYL